MTSLSGVRTRLSAACAAALVLLCAPQAFAAPMLAADVTQQVDGRFEYRYTLTNSPDNAENLFDLGLFFFGDPFNVLAPPDWEHIEGLGFIDWLSPGPATDLLPGASLGGFSFDSLFGPGTIRFQTTGFDPIAFQVGSVVDGTTIGPVEHPPTPVPEPSTIWLMGSSLVAMVWCGGKRRIHADSSRSTDTVSPGAPWVLAVSATSGSAERHRALALVRQGRV